MRAFIKTLGVVCVAVMAACASEPQEDVAHVSRVELGERLFFDPVLSGGLNRSCATCHLPEQGFAGPPMFDGGISAPPLIEVAKLSRQGRANPLVRRLEDQAHIALFGLDPVEMGLEGKEQVLYSDMGGNPLYCNMLIGGVWQANTCSGGVDVGQFMMRVEGALAAYMRSLRLDECVDTDVERSDFWRAGERLFYGSGGCVRCHSGQMYSNAYGSEEPSYYHSQLWFERGDEVLSMGRLEQGLYAVSKRPEDLGKIKVPTLRGVGGKHYFFMHGEEMTLSQAIGVHAPQLDGDEVDLLVEYLSDVTWCK